MGELVRHQRDQRAVAGQDRRRGEGQPRVLHAAVGVARRQDEEVVAPPFVGAVELLGGGDHLRRVGELPGGAFDHRRQRVDAAVRPQRAEVDVPHGERQQVGGDRLRHLETVDAVGAARGRVLGAHQGELAARRVDRRLVGHAHGRAVLAGDPGAGEDRLRLRVEERRGAAGLCRGQPLEGRRLRLRRVVDVDPGGGGGDLDLERPAEELHLVAELPLRRALPRVEGDAADVEVARVEHQAGGAAAILEAQAGAAGERALGEVDRELELQVLDRDLLGVRERMGIERRVGHGLDGRRYGRGSRGGRGRRDRHRRGHGDGCGRPRGRRAVRRGGAWRRRDAAAAGGQGGQNEEEGGGTERLHRGGHLRKGEQQIARGKSVRSARPGKNARATRRSKSRVNPAPEGAALNLEPASAGFSLRT